MWRPPCDPPPPPCRPLGPDPPIVSLSSLPQILPLQSTHAYNLKKRPMSLLFSSPAHPPAKSSQTQPTQTQHFSPPINNPHCCHIPLHVFDAVEVPDVHPPPAHHLQTRGLCLESKMAAVALLLRTSPKQLLCPGQAAPPPTHKHQPNRITHQAQNYTNKHGKGY